MNILVTGAAGFIGSHLCERLLKEDNKVIGLDNLSTGSWDNVQVLKQYDNFTFAIADVSHTDDIAKYYVEDIERVYHFASPASPVDYQAQPFNTMKVNTIGTENLLNLCSTNKARLLFASTSEIYGDPLEHPQKETYLGNVSTTGPRSVYDEAKRFGETICSAYRRRKNVDAKIVRIFNTYGPRMQVSDGRVIPNFISQALTGNPLTIYGTGKQTRSFCFVSDLVDGLILLMESDIDTPVNLGNDHELNMVEVAEIINKETNNKGGVIYEELPIDDPKKRKPNLDFAKSTLYYSPKIPFETGIRETISYFRQLVF